MVISWQQALKELGSGKCPKVVLLHGEDQYMRSLMVAQIIRNLEHNGDLHVSRQDPLFKEKKIKGRGDDSSNTEEQGLDAINDATDPSPDSGTSDTMELDQDIVSAFNSGGLFSSTELIIMPSALYAKVASLLAGFPETLTVVFQSTRKIPSNHKVFKAAGWKVDCSPLKGKDFINWMIGEAHRHGHTLPVDAADYLHQISGDNMGIVINELEKFSIYLGGQGPINLALVKNLGSHTVGRTYFELSDAVADGNFKGLMAVLESLMEQKEPPYKVLAIVNNYFRQLMEAALFRKERKASNSFELAQIMHINPYPAQKLWNQTNRWTPGKLEAVLWIILKTDHAMKNGGGDPDLLLQAALADVSNAVSGIC